MLKELRLAVCQKQEQDGHSKVYPLIAFCCTIHQLALARKPLLIGFPQFWSSIVRLSHLFEVHSFRIHLRTALLDVICQSFRYIQVCQLPAEAGQWLRYRKKCIGVITDQQTGFNKKRLELHLQLMRYDNGNIENSGFTHFYNQLLLTTCSHHLNFKHMFYTNSSTIHTVKWFSRIVSL